MFEGFFAPKKEVSPKPVSPELRVNDILRKSLMENSRFLEELRKKARELRYIPVTQEDKRMQDLSVDEFNYSIELAISSIEKDLESTRNVFGESIEARRFDLINLKNDISGMKVNKNKMAA